MNFKSSWTSARDTTSPLFHVDELRNFSNATKRCSGSDVPLCRTGVGNLSAACGFKNNPSDGDSPQGRVSEHVKNTGLSTRVPSGSVSQPFLGGASQLLCVDVLLRRQSGSLIV